MNRPQVVHFLSGVLAHFPTGARNTTVKVNPRLIAAVRKAFG